MSFRRTRETLLLAYDSKIISDEEFLVLWESCRSKNRDFPHSSYARFDLENIDETECLAEFRVRKQDIPVLANVLQLPVNIRCPQRTICDRIEGYACYWEGFRILAVIQIWSADLKDQFQSYAWLRTKSWTTFSTITATEYLNGMTISWILIRYRSMLMSYMQKVPH